MESYEICMQLLWKFSLAALDRKALCLGTDVKGWPALQFKKLPTKERGPEGLAMIARGALEST